jgi:predicted transcriptional regulator
MKIKKAVLIVEPPKDAMNRAFSILAKPLKRFAGMTIISFPDFTTLGKVITGSRVELLSAIRHQKPKSIQELAKFVGRDFKNVYQDVKLLSEFGIIELKEMGPRKSSTPVSLYSELVIAA